MNTVWQMISTDPSASTPYGTCCSSSTMRTILTSWTTFWRNSAEGRTRPVGTTASSSLTLSRGSPTRRHRNWCRSTCCPEYSQSTKSFAECLYTVLPWSIPLRCVYDVCVLLVVFIRVHAIKTIKNRTFSRLWKLLKSSYRCLFEVSIGGF